MPTASDVDGDRLDDNCEYAIARAFSPLLWYDLRESCPDGYPHWAATVMPNGKVRVAYMPAYNQDCGLLVPGFLGSGAHSGDGEIVMIQVVYNTGTQHWEFDKMWLSAHFQWGQGDSNWYLIPLGKGGLEYSEWVGRTGASCYSRYLAYPDVYVSANKHANYRSKSACNNGVDYCDNYYAVRFAVEANRNVGSQYVPLIGCIASAQPQYSSTGRTECFYTNRGNGFQGWNAVQQGKRPHSYYENLMLVFNPSDGK